MNSQYPNCVYCGGVLKEGQGQMTCVECGQAFNQRETGQFSCSATAGLVACLVGEIRLIRRLLESDDDEPTTIEIVEGEEAQEKEPNEQRPKEDKGDRPPPRPPRLKPDKDDELPPEE